MEQTVRVPSFLLYVEIKLKSNVRDSRNNIKSTIDASIRSSDLIFGRDFRKSA